MTTPPGGASACNRAARLGVSPTTALGSPPPISAGGDADAGAEPYSPPVEAGYGFRDLQTGAHRSFGIVLMGDRKAEIGQHAVAQVFREKPVEPPNHLSRAPMVGPQHPAQLFGIETRRQDRRVG